MQFKFLPEITIEEAVKKALQLKEFNGIGTYGERLLHSVLKMYFCPDEKCHEVNYKGFVADIFIDKSRPLIIEIQTRQLFKLQRKLEIYGEDADIVIVFLSLRKRKRHGLTLKMEISQNYGDLRKGEINTALSESCME